mmetsp:Transcript_32212/g.102542  ORF Transcript_32212/g.102542 Transcript_32212/m.102542 type:complete len:664 (-) Transcript_32212:56-2047(-)
MTSRGGEEMLLFCCLFCLLSTLPSQATSISFGAASRVDRIPPEDRPDLQLLNLTSQSYIVFGRNQQTGGSWSVLRCQGDPCNNSSIYLPQTVFCHNKAFLAPSELHVWIENLPYHSHVRLVQSPVTISGCGDPRCLHWLCTIPQQEGLTVSNLIIDCKAASTRKVSRWIQQQRLEMTEDQVMSIGVLRKRKCQLLYHITDKTSRAGGERRGPAIQEKETGESKWRLTTPAVDSSKSTSKGYGRREAEVVGVLGGLTAVYSWRPIVFVLSTALLCSALLAIACLCRSSHMKFNFSPSSILSRRKGSSVAGARKKTKKKQGNRKERGGRPLSEQEQTRRNAATAGPQQTRQEVRRRRQEVASTSRSAEEEEEINQPQFMTVTRNGKKRAEGGHAGPCGLYNGVRGHENLCFMNSAIQLLFFAIKDFDRDLQMCSCAVASALRNLRVTCRERASAGKPIDKQTSNSFRDCIHRWVPLIVPSQQRQGQCDVHEFLESILQIVREDLRSQIPKEEHTKMGHFCEQYLHRLEGISSRQDQTEFLSMMKILGEVKWDFDVLGMCVENSRTRRSRLSSSSPSFVGQILTHTWDLSKQTMKGCEFEPFNVLVASLEASGESIGQLLNRYFHEDIPEGTDNIKRTTKMWKLPRSLIVCVRRFRFDKGFSSPLL